MTDNEQEFQRRTAEMRAGFVAKAAERLAEMQAALDSARAAADVASCREHVETLHGVAHKLVGAAGLFGLPELSDTGREFLRLAVAAESLAGHVGGETFADLQRQLKVMVAVSTETVPAEAAETPAPKAETGSPPHDRAAPRRTLLVVDDDPIQVAMLGAHMSLHGWNSVNITDLEQLDAALARHEPAALVLDIKFPGEEMAGLLALRRIQAQGGFSGPVMVVSSRNDFEARLEAVRRGVAGYFTKPVDPSDLADALQRAVPAEPEAPLVTVVDDEPVVAAVTAAALSREGFRVEVFTDPRDLPQAIRSQPPDAIVMDVNMPVCDGFELAKLLRQDPEATHIPIIFLTAEGGAERELSGFRAGGDALVEKSEGTDRLVEMVRTRISRSDELRHLFTRVRQSETQFRAVARTALEAIVLVDHQENIIYWNNGAENIFGHPAHEALGRSLSWLLWGEGKPEAAEGSGAGLAGRTTKVDAPRRGGGTVTVEVSATRWEVGSHSFLTCIARDVTERRQMEERTRTLNRELEQRVAERTSEVTHANEQLRVLQQRLDGAIDAIPEGFLLFDGGRRLVRRNDAMARVLGVDAGVLALGRLEEEILADVRELGPLQHSNSGTAEPESPADPVERTGEFPLPDNRWVRFSLSTTAEGGHVVLCADITQRKRAEQDQAYSEERLAGILALAVDAIISIDEEQRIVMFNHGAEEVFGYTAEEVMGRSLDLLLPERVRGEHGHQVSQFQQGQSPHRFKGGHRAVTGLRRDGEEFPAEASISQITSHRGNTSTVILRDISARVQAERELARSEARLKQALDIARLGTCEWLLDQDLVHLSAETCQIMGIAPGNQAGFLGPPQLFYDRVHPEDLPLLHTAMNKAIENKELCKAVFRAVLPDGETRTVEAQGEICPDEQGRPQLAATMHDITERVVFEQQLRQAQKMEAVGALAGGVAHDFNNMLQIVRGYSSLALDRIEQPEKVSGYLKRVLTATENASSLTQQLLAFSRRQTLHRNPVDLNAVITTQVGMLGRLIRQDIELKVIPCAEATVVEADAGMLEQVIINMALNARDAMPDGGALTLELSRHAADAAFCRTHGWARPITYVVVRVSDTGTGIAPEVRDRVFEPFFTTKEVGKGTGLGLAMVYGIMQQHDGMISVYSEPGLGTTFTLYFPEKVGEPARAEPDLVEEPVNWEETILVAEDEPDVRNLVVTLLEESGYRVLSARDGVEALEMFKANRDLVDLALLDMIMPRKNGIGLYRDLMALRPDLPVLFSTGYAGETTERDFLAENNLPVVRKPYNPSDLFAAVREALRGKH